MAPTSWQGNSACITTLWKIQKEWVNCQRVQTNWESLLYSYLLSWEQFTQWDQYYFQSSHNAIATLRYHNIGTKLSAHGMDALKDQLKSYPNCNILNAFHLYSYSIHCLEKTEIYISVYKNSYLKALLSKWGIDACHWLCCNYI